MSFLLETKANIEGVNAETVRLALLENKDKYYTYSLNDQDKPFYIGKGINKRIFYHERELNHPTEKSNRHKLSTLKNTIDNDTLTYSIQGFFSDPKEALDHEIKLINLYGRENLTNLTDGGDGAINLSPESIESMRSKLIGKTGPNKGKILSEETKQKMSEAKLGKPAHNRGIRMSSESCAKMSASKVGKSTWNLGLSFSEESRKKMSDSHKGIKPSSDTLLKRSVSIKANHWSKTEAFKARYPNTTFGAPTTNVLQVN